jgi:hypothetical protein
MTFIPSTHSLCFQLEPRHTQLEYSPASDRSTARLTSSQVYGCQWRRFLLELVSISLYVHFLTCLMVHQSERSLGDGWKGGGWQRFIRRMGSCRSQVSVHQTCLYLFRSLISSTNFGPKSLYRQVTARQRGGALQAAGTIRYSRILPPQALHFTCPVEPMVQICIPSQMFGSSPSTEHYPLIWRLITRLAPGTAIPLATQVTASIKLPQSCRPPSSP